MTERAMRILQPRVIKVGGTIRDAIEIWTSRPNKERHGLSDSEAIMRRAGERLTLTPQRKTA